LFGSDVELAAQFAEQLGVTPIFVHTWPTLLESACRPFRYRLSGISTSQSVRVASFSVAYVWVREVFLTRRRDASQYPNLASLDHPEIRVLVYPGGTGEHFARAHLHRAQIVTFPDKGGAFEEIRAGRVNAMFTDEVDGKVRVHSYPDLSYTFADSPMRDPKAILMPRGSDLVPAVDAGYGISFAAGEADTADRAASTRILLSKSAP
jgi:cyclohexadienyl dehydratase